MTPRFIKKLKNFTAVDLLGLATVLGVSISETDREGNKVVRTDAEQIIKEMDNKFKNLSLDKQDEILKIMRKIDKENRKNKVKK